MLNTIMSELGQKYTHDYIFQSLYIVLNSKKRKEIKIYRNMLIYL